MFRGFFLFVFGLYFVLISFGANASTTGGVGSPNVRSGESSIGFRLGYSEADTPASQDNRLRARVHYDHGFNEWYAFRVVVSGDKRKASSFEHDSIGIENRFHLLKRDKHGFDFGVRLNYTLKDGDKKPDSGSVRFYELFRAKDWEFRLNQIFDHDVGQDSESGIQLSLRHQVSYPVSETHRLGLESFHEFGNLKHLSGYENQSHTVGPVLKGNIGGGLSYETGYRIGVSRNAPDHNFKFFIQKAF